MFFDSKVPRGAWPASGGMPGQAHWLKGEDLQNILGTHKGKISRQEAILIVWSKREVFSRAVHVNHSLFLFAFYFTLFYFNTFSDIWKAQAISLAFCNFPPCSNNSWVWRSFCYIVSNNPKRFVNVTEKHLGLTVSLISMSKLFLNHWCAHRRHIIFGWLYPDGRCG